jgi:hypothetical protein
MISNAYSRLDWVGLGEAFKYLSVYGEKSRRKGGVGILGFSPAERVIYGCMLSHPSIHPSKVTLKAGPFSHHHHLDLLYPPPFLSFFLFSFSFFLSSSKKPEVGCVIRRFI